VVAVQLFEIDVLAWPPAAGRAGRSLAVQAFPHLADPVHVIVDGTGVNVGDASRSCVDPDAEGGIPSWGKVQGRVLPHPDPWAGAG